MDRASQHAAIVIRAGHHGNCLMGEDTAAGKRGQVYTMHAELAAHVMSRAAMGGRSARLEGGHQIPEFGDAVGAKEPAVLIFDLTIETAIHHPG